MVDKLFTVPAAAVGEVVGQLEPQVLVDLGSGPAELAGAPLMASASDGVATGLTLDLVFVDACKAAVG